MMRALTALTVRELRRIIRNPQAVATGLMLPILYLLLFGQAFNFGKIYSGIPGGQAALLLLLRGAPTYFSYFSAGMAGFVSVTATLFIGANVIFDKMFGVLKRTASTPVGAAPIFISRLIAGCLQPILLAILVLFLAIGLGDAGLSGLKVTANVSALGFLEIFLAIVILSAMFASLFLAIGFSIDTPQTYFAIVNVINLPVLLTSAALYPWGILPGWLQTVASYNPITLCVEVLRENLFAGASSYYPYAAWYYLLGLMGWAAAMFVIATLLAAKALAPKQ